MVDTVWSWYSLNYDELKDIFEENKQAFFDSKSRTLSHFVPFEEHMHDNVDGIVQLLAILGNYMRMVN